MKTSTFRIVPLRSEVAEGARRAAEAGAADHAVVLADSPSGYPCRHCLHFAKPGERLILFPYAAIPAGHPYSESGPIFVHAEQCERYRALLNRDASFEGIFFIGVRTTGIFCRPTCPAKKPARENVDFFASSSEALESGYRPCLRCDPMEPGKRPPKLIERLCSEVERA